MKNKKSRISVVIPCYKVRHKVMDVIHKVGDEVQNIYVIDDCCPEDTGDFVMANCTDKRVKVIKHPENKGVGGAVLTGYEAAIHDDSDIIVKIDGDGQMNPIFISSIVSPIQNGEADYTKGNRFYDLEKIDQMPKSRLLGNAALSFLNKLSSGYWNIFDPTNGFTAIQSDVARRLPFKKISKRYFFETDMLFRLNTIRAVVIDVPMDAYYADEESNLIISHVAFEFLYKHFKNFIKRVFYNYYLRDMSLASFELPIGLILMVFGSFYGVSHWIASYRTGELSSAGTVMLSGISVLVGLQLLLAFIAYDIRTVPTRPLQKDINSLW